MSSSGRLVSLLLRGLGWMGLALLLVVIFLSDFLAHAPAGATFPGAELLPPSSAHPFGTDALGRDVFSESEHGLHQTGKQAIAAALISIFAGGFFGVVAARLPQIPAQFLRGVIGILAAVPALLLTMVIVGLCGHDTLAYAAGLAVAPISFLRGFASADISSPHARYARATGISGLTLLRRDLTYDFQHILPQVLARALAAVTILVSTTSFLGFGASPPARDLGLMIAAAKTSYLTEWWTALFPGVVLVLFVLCARLAAGLEEGERA